MMMMTWLTLSLHQHFVAGWQSDSVQVGWEAHSLVSDDRSDPSPLNSKHFHLHARLCQSPCSCPLDVILGRYISKSKNCVHVNYFND